MSRALTWVLLLLPVLGVGLIAVGSQEWYPETWLDSKGFVINLASAFTAACFGLPLAYVVLQRILKSQEERARKEQIMHLAYSSLERMHDAAEIMLPTGFDGDSDDVGKLLQGIEQHLQYEALPNYQSLKDRLVSSIITLYPRLVLVAERWETVKATWRFLSTDLYFRAIFDEIDLLSERANTFFSQYAAGESPLDELWGIPAWFTEKERVHGAVTSFPGEGVPQSLAETIRKGSDGLSLMKEMRLMMLNQMTHLRQEASRHGVALPSETSTLETELDHLTPKH